MQQVSMVVAAVVALVNGSSAQCPQWSAEFQPSGISGIVNAMSQFDDGGGPRMALGGSFQLVGAVPSTNVAAWNGTQWSALGAGLDGAIHALAAHDDGNGERLYAAGEFDSSGATTVNRIARFDGASWQPLGSGLNDRAYALAEFDDGSDNALYVAGNFTTAGGVPCERIARWNGAWSAIGDPGVGTLRALEVYDLGSGPRLFAAGAQVVSMWDGASWTLLGSDYSGTVRALHGFDDGSGPAVYATGNFLTMDGVFASGIARWNGAVWQGVGGGLGAFGDTLGVHDDGSGPALYVSSAGANVLRRWSGAGWSSLGDDLSSTIGGLPRINSIAEFETAGQRELFIAGDLGFSGDRTLWSVAKRSNGEWVAPHPVGEALDGRVHDFATADLGAGERLIAVGDFRRAGGAAAKHVAQWDGAHWQTLGEGFYGNPRALAHHDDGSGDKLYAGGVNLFSQIEDALGRWNGTSWELVPGLRGRDYFDGGVLSLASYPVAGAPRLFAAGDFELSQAQPGQPAVGTLASWNGSQWSIVPTHTYGDVYRLEVIEFGGASHLYALGNFDSIAGTPANRIARFDGTQWSDFGAGLDLPPGSSLHALELHDDGSGPALFALGVRFGGVNYVERIAAKYDGVSWVEIGAWTNFSPLDLASYDDGFGPGLFASAGTTNTTSTGSRLRVWRNGAWSNVAGVPTTPSGQYLGRMFVHRDGQSPQGSLWFGTGVMTLGSSVSWGAARYFDACACDAVAYCTSGTTSSGCVSAISGVGRASASATTSFSIVLSGLEGARSGHIFYGVGGSHASPWGQSSHFLCVKAPTQRTPTQTTGGTSGSCDGAMALDWNAYVQSHPNSLGAPFEAGDQIWAQAFLRDPAGVKTTALSNALRFTICP